MTFALLLALDLPLRAAESPEAVVKRVVIKTEKLIATQKGKAQVKPLGWKDGRIPPSRSRASRRPSRPCAARNSYPPYRQRWRYGG